MDGSMGMGCMAVFAVSGSVALLALQVHKRLLSDFMKRIDFEFGYGRCQAHQKRRVHFIKNATGAPSDYKSESTSILKPSLKKSDMELEGSMPLNRLALYKGIIRHKMLYPKKEYGVSRGRNVSQVQF